MNEKGLFRKFVNQISNYGILVNNIFLILPSIIFLNNYPILCFSLDGPKSINTKYTYKKELKKDNSNRK